MAPHEFSNETLFHIYCEYLNGIVQLQLYAGPDKMHMMKCGTLSFDNHTWIDFRRRILNKVTGAFELHTQGDVHE